MVYDEALMTTHPDRPAGATGLGAEPIDTLVRTREGHGSIVLRAGTLTVAAGPDAGTRCSLKLRRTRVGSAEDNQLVLTDPLVSRHHLEFQVQDRGYLVRDLDSTNGTHFRGARLGEALGGPILSDLAARWHVQSFQGLVGRGGEA